MHSLNTQGIRPYALRVTLFNVSLENTSPELYGIPCPVDTTLQSVGIPDLRSVRHTIVTTLYLFTINPKMSMSMSMPLT
eukprot:COSAG02_NODE_4184_length_5655_cov_2.189885_6_plen_79_part_00